MRHYFNISFILASFMTGGTMRAATKPHRGPARVKANLTSTNGDLERLRKFPGLISVVGQPSNNDSQNVSAPRLQSRTEDPRWYAARAATLNARLETEQANLRDFTQALDDARELKATKGGINLAEEDIAITPEVAIDIRRSRVRETQSERDALEDLARQNDIPPGVLRGQWQGVSNDKAVAATEQSQSDRSARGGDL